MTGLACTYCGEEIYAEDESVNEKIECPSCGHPVTARQRRPLGTRDSRDPNEESKSEDTRFLEGKSDQEIVRWLNCQTLIRMQETKCAARREVSRSMVKYDDLTLFALSLAFALLCTINHDLRRDLFLVFIVPRGGVFVIFAMVGMVLCLLNIFVRHEKPEIEKKLMLIFALVVTAATGVYSGYITLTTGIPWLIVFPAWNIINSIALLCAYDAGIVNAHSITDERPGILQALVAIGSITFLVMMCQYVFNLHWAVTYSIAVSYTMSLLSSVQAVFSRRHIWVARET
ncbi:MAG: TFIIB-type zinc ribbon-containing protein [Planctomycetota bacterium]|jgi:DNA-directed RNA polymerase subunit RPC12/RpoP